MFVDPAGLQQEGLDLNNWEGLAELTRETFSHLILKQSIIDLETHTQAMVQLTADGYPDSWDENRINYWDEKIQSNKKQLLSMKYNYYLGGIVLDEYLEPDRKGSLLQEVKAIVIHNTANPNMTPEDWVDNYWDEKANAHFIVDKDGRIVITVPANEIAAHVGDDGGNITYSDDIKKMFPDGSAARNTIGIEMTNLDWNFMKPHPNDSFNFSDETLKSTISLTAFLIDTLNLEFADSNMLRHGDITGKICPYRFINYPSEWEAFKYRVNALVIQ